MKNLIKYNSDGTYSRKELTLSAKTKKNLFKYIEEAKSQYGRCSEIYVAAKWDEPVNNLEYKNCITTWLFYLTFDKKIQVLHINRKATY